MILHPITSAEDLIPEGHAGIRDPRKDTIYCPLQLHKAYPTVPKCPPLSDLHILAYNSAAFSEDTPEQELQGQYSTLCSATH